VLWSNKKRPKTEPTRSSFERLLKIVFPLLLGGAILYWMYRDFDFGSIRQVLFYKMDWTWMLLSFPFGIMAQVFRAWRGTSVAADG